MESTQCMTKQKPSWSCKTKICFSLKQMQTQQRPEIYKMAWKKLVSITSNIIQKSHNDRSHFPRKIWNKNTYVIPWPCYMIQLHRSINAIGLYQKTIQAKLFFNGFFYSFLRSYNWPLLSYISSPSLQFLARSWNLPLHIQRYFEILNILKP